MQRVCMFVRSRANLRGSLLCLVRHQREHIQRFQAGVRTLAEVVECHHVTGNFDYLLRVEVADLAAYERFHADTLAALHNVGQVVTYISMTDFTDA